MEILARCECRYFGGRYCSELYPEEIKTSWNRWFSQRGEMTIPLNSLSGTFLTCSLVTSGCSACRVLIVTVIGFVVGIRSVIPLSPTITATIATIVLLPLIWGALRPRRHVWQFHNKVAQPVLVLTDYGTSTAKAQQFVDCLVAQIAVVASNSNTAS